MNIPKVLLDALHPLYLFSSLIPKSRDIWVFGAWFGQKFTDNPKRVFLYATAASEKTCVWIARSSQLVRSLREQGYRAHHYLSLFGIYYQMRAGAAFFSHDTDKDMLGPAISGKTLRFQLWHGTPLKKIRYGCRTNSIARPDSKLRQLAHWAFPWKSDTNYDFVPAASEVSVGHFKEAFQTEHVYVTGYPRNDALVPGDIADPRPVVTRCIYMPTFRGEFRTTESSLQTGQFLLSTGFDVNRLDQLFTQAGITMTLRLHPTNMPAAGMMEQIRQSRSISFDSSEEIYELLNTYDVLITDYSSIFFDFAITGKPIIHAPFDLEEYKRRNRDMYFEYEEVCLTPNVRSWDDVMEMILTLRQDGVTADYAKRYRSLAHRFNHYIDSSSSRRVYEWARDRVC